MSYYSSSTKRNAPGVRDPEKLDPLPRSRQIPVCDALHATDNVSPAFPIQYRFLDEKLNTLYDRELKQKKVFSVFSSVSILLACMGVYGLVSHSTRRREKELGIRKILGANLLQVFQIISKEFLTLIMVSAALSIPIAYYAMANWLTDFAYHIDLMQYWYVFLVGSALAFIVSFLSIGFSTYKAAAINPTDSIRYE